MDTIALTVLYCPRDVTATVELGTMETTISWIEPMVIDASGIVIKRATYDPGHEFTVGSTEVSYHFDKFHNHCECNFTVKITSSKEFFLCV